MIIAAWLTTSNHILTTSSNSPQLDAEIILAHTIKKSRSWLHAHSDETIDLRSQEIADARVDLRVDGVPVAYIVGHKEFYGRTFIVTPSVLIPRPESEEIIELLNEVLPKTQELGTRLPSRLVDIGTGSGCLGITAKIEHPELDVTLIDLDTAAMAVAKKNADTLNTDVTFVKSDLLYNYPYSADIVLANLPYVSRKWKLDSSIRHEPEQALYAADDGLFVIKKCFDELSHRTKKGALTIFEADPRQWDIIIDYAQSLGFSVKRSKKFAVCFEKTR